MVNISGTLAIRSIKGARGNFNVGRLFTDIGEFAVKDPLIEEYDEGRYEGQFGIAQIFPSHYVAGGRMVVEVRARISSIALANVDRLEETDRPVTLVEQDPIEAEGQRPAAAPSQTLLAQADVEKSTATEPVADETPDGADQVSLHAELFGELWPLDPRVKLDPTVDRQRFRAQRDALKSMGYTFQPIGQLWVSNAIAA